ncbi:hypothetical protein GCM10027448_35870 [Nocardioides dilutus]
MAGEDLELGGLEDPLRQWHQVWLERAKELPGVAGSGQGADLDLGVTQQETQQLTTGVPAGSGDRDGLPAHVA